MINYINKNVVDIERGVIAHGCNYFGVMGAGVAKAIKNKFPEAFRQYAVWLENFEERKFALGCCRLVAITEDLWIANCITQGLQQIDGQLATPEAIKESLRIAYLHASFEGLPLYLPKIGAGLGGLNWESDVEPIIVELSTAFPDVYTYVCIWP